MFYPLGIGDFETTHEIVRGCNYFVLYVYFCYYSKQEWFSISILGLTLLRSNGRHREFTSSFRLM